MSLRLLLDAVSEARDVIRAHSLRAALAVLAIAVAVATIATVVVALDGVERFARTSAARAFGSNTFVLAKVAAPGRISRRELEQRLQRNPNILRGDLQFVERYAAGRVTFGATVNRRVEVAAGPRRYEGASLVAATASLAAIRDLAIGDGRFFSREEAGRAALLTVIGATIAEELFPGIDPLGQMIRIAGRGFRVVGLQERQGNIGGVSLDRNVWIPLRAGERLFGPPETLQLLARPASGDNETAVQRAEDQAHASMRARRQLQPGEEDNFDMLAPEAARGFVLTLSERAGMAAGPISAMALLAAIVVVANTILVSVAQRTADIGIRRAVGASRKQLMAEVLAESLLIGVAGAVIGISFVLLLVSVANGSGLELELRASTALYSLLAAAMSGMIAGWYPARLATRIDVVDALRVE